MPELAPAAPTAVAPTPAGPHPATFNRRQRLRLRDLCDEVLASYRVARDRDVISEVDRADARTLLARLTPQRG